MSLCVARHAPGIAAALDAAAGLDVCRARALLGRDLRGVVPEVRGEGVLRLEKCRHALLQLREIRGLVGNDVSFSADTPALIITGPNAGGKTVVMKSIGLAAMLCKLSVPVPANPGARVDLFDGVYVTALLLLVPVL